MVRRAAVITRGPTSGSVGNPGGGDSSALFTEESDAGADPELVRGHHALG